VGILKLQQLLTLIQICFETLGHIHLLEEINNIVISDVYLYKTAGEVRDFRCVLSSALDVEKKRMNSNFRAGYAHEADTLTDKKVEHT
jgi:hypothetical protein